jgi:hypothetical protein
MPTKRRAARKPEVPRTKTPSLLDLFPGHRKAAYLERARAALEKSVGGLAHAYRHRGLVLYVGAGVSISVGLPSWADMVRSLTVRMMTRKVESAISALGELKDEARWKLFDGLYEDLQANQQYEKPILMLARSLKNELGTNLSNEIARVLYRRFFNRLIKGRRVYHRKGFSVEYRGVRRETHAFPPESFRHYPLLEAVASLARAERDANGVQAIVNYNYDDLVEEYLKAQKIKCMTVLSGGDKVPDGVLPSYHVHGLIRSADFLSKKRRPGLQSKGNFVFSEDEYHAEYSDPYRWSNMTQMSHLGRYTGLFIGLSMEDPNIRRLIDVTHRQYPETRNFAILSRRQPLARSKDDKRTLLRNLFEEVETSSFERIGVGVLWVDRHDDIPGVLSKIVEEAAV